MERISRTPKMNALAVLVTCVFFLDLWPVHAQVTSVGPSATTRLKSCDDFATNVLHDPWDMSSNSDINNFTTTDIGYLGSMSFSGGAFNAITTAANQAFFYLLSPKLSTPVGGRYGHDQFNRLRLDTLKYSRFAMRMRSTLNDPAGYRMLWNRSNSYVLGRTVLTAKSVSAGWKLYQADLNSGVTISAAESSNTTPWSAGNIFGFAVMPTQLNGNTLAIDYIRIEDPSSCATYNLPYTALASGSDQLVSVWVDDDQDPLNGYYLKPVTAASAGGAATVPVTLTGLQPGSYRVVALLGSDYATLERDDPWDMSEASDVAIAAGVSASASGGVYSGTTTSTEPAIYLTVPSGGFAASKYSKLSFKLTRSTGALFNIFWTNQSGLTGMVVDPAVADADHDDVYQIDLAQQAAWTGTISQIILRPANASGVSFGLDWVSLRNSGFVTRLTSPNFVSSLGTIDINTPPTFEIKQPDYKGGEAFKSWNMNNGDFAVLQNLRNDADPAHPGENYSSYLPDVRLVGGLRGDFFKGTSVLGNDDPNGYLTFPLVPGSPNIDGSVYHTLCVKQLLDHEFDLCLGSISRPVWLRTDSNDYSVSIGWVSIYDRWSGSKWYEYCMDLADIALEDPSAKPWGGVVTALRFDPHEFSKDACGSDGNPTGNKISVPFYYDYLKLRRDDVAHGAFNIVLDSTDPDDTAQVSLYYNTQNSTSGGTLITTLNKGVTHYRWDTSAIPNGNYFVYGVATDGLNTTQRLATGRIQIDNSVPGNSQVPLLTVQAPTEGQAVCNSLQLKGYALQPDRNEDVALVEVLDGTTQIASFEPNAFSLAARTAYPQLDSSNSGFDRFIDVSSFQTGSHTLTFRAISTDGNSTDVTVNVTKQASRCPDPIVDPDPSGTPVAVDVSAGAPQDGTAPVIQSIKLNKKGALTIVIGNANEGNKQCTVGLYLGLKNKSVTSLVKTYTLSQAKLTLSTSRGASVSQSKIPTLFVKLTKSCDGYKDLASSVKKLTIPRGMRGLKSIAQIAPQFAKVLKPRLGSPDSRK